MNSLSLYLHFPFCRKKCAYCDFYSLPDLSNMSHYEDALCRALVEFAPEAAGDRVETVYFGGGTPSLVSPTGLTRLFSTLRCHFHLSPDAEITMEMNPESVSPQILKICREEGIGRISLGMQSARDEELSLLGRIHRFAEVEQAVSRIREQGFQNLNLDLMYGLPGQTLSQVMESLEKTVALSPDHISFYLLTLSDSVPLAKKEGLLPQEEAAREMYLAAVSYLEKMGYRQYEISNAARDGKRSRHNQVYWTGGAYLGLGPGAHSDFHGKRFAMAPDLAAFLRAKSCRDTIVDSYRPDREDRKTEYIMLSLRTVEGLDFETLLSLSDPAFCRRAKEQFALWERLGLARKTKAGYALTPEGFFVSNAIITKLI